MKKYDNAQEIVNAVVNGLRSQGFERSLSLGRQCKVRGDQGFKCAAGWLLPDEAYTPAMETISTLVDHCVHSSSQELSVLVTELRIAHDRSRSPMDMEIKLRTIVAAHNLVWPEAT